MLKLCSYLFFLSLFAFPVVALEDQANLRRVAEYHVPASDLLTFSRDGAQVILCETCVPESISIANNIEFYEFEQSINLKRATELYIRKPYQLVFIGIDRTTSTAVYFRFGGHSDDSDTPQGEAQ